MGGILGPLGGEITCSVAVLAVRPRCHLWGLRAHYGVNAATHRAEVPLLSRCTRAVGVKRA